MCSKLADVTQIYHDDPNLKKQDVNLIFHWLQTQPHLPGLTELQVILFLHSCYYNTEETKTAIEFYFTLRTTSELFCSGDENFIRKTLSTFVSNILLKKTPEGYCVWISGLLDPKVENFDYSEFVRLSIMVTILYFHQYGPPNGLIVVVDVSKFSFSHLFKLSLHSLKVFLQFVQEAAPTRIKGIHFVNIVAATKPLIALMRPFLKKELYDIIRLHTYSFESLYEFVPKECLPQEYGGTIGKIIDIQNTTMSNLIENLDFFKWHDSQQIDEAKRVVKRSRGYLSSLFFRSE